MENIDIDIDIDKDNLKDIDIDIDINMAILENIDIDIDIDEEILQIIDIDKISYRLGFGISNTPNHHHHNHHYRHCQCGLLTCGFSQQCDRAHHVHPQSSQLTSYLIIEFVKNIIFIALSEDILCYGYLHHAM